MLHRLSYNLPSINLQKYFWGIFLFLLITLPCHIIMLKLYDNLFLDEYIIKHHILRFLDLYIAPKVELL